MCDAGPVSSAPLFWSLFDRWQICMYHTTSLVCTSFRRLAYLRTHACASSRNAAHAYVYENYENYENHVSRFFWFKRIPPISVKLTLLVGTWKYGFLIEHIHSPVCCRRVSLCLPPPPPWEIFFFECAKIFRSSNMWRYVVGLQRKWPYSQVNPVRVHT